MDNGKISSVFDELADLLEFRGENPFRIPPTGMVPKRFGDLNESVANLLSDSKRDMASIPGIGKDSGR